MDRLPHQDLSVKTGSAARHTVLPHATVPARTVLSVMTLNVRHGRGLSRPQQLLRRGVFRRNASRVAGFLREHPVDVVALQEADGRSSWSGSFDHVGHMARECACSEYAYGIHFSVHRPRVYFEYGTALYSRLPMTDIHSSSFKARPFDTKGYLVATVVFGGREVDVVSVHLDVVPPSRRRQAAAMVRELSARGRPLVVMGDMNCKGKYGLSAVQVLRSGLSLSSADTDNMHQPTFPTRRPRRRIDWILLSPELEVASCRIIPHDVTDHLAVTADLVWR
jgi:endonuclease/exonuclease/phosphatase family metal-dependent hydrolase